MEDGTHEELVRLKGFYYNMMVIGNAEKKADKDESAQLVNVEKQDRLLSDGEKQVNAPSTSDGKSIFFKFAKPSISTNDFIQRRPSRWKGR